MTKLTLISLLLISHTVQAIEIDSLFHKQFRKDIGGWIAADATYSIWLPDGRTLWLFGDTFIGEVNPDNTIKSGSKFIRNSAVIQDGDHLNTLHGGTRSNPTDFIPASHPDSLWYWPEHGIVEDDSLLIFVAKFRKKDNGTDGFNFEHAGNDIAIFTYPELIFFRSEPILASEVNAVLYGNKVLTDTNYVYIYGRKSEPEYNIPYPHAARAAIGSVKSQNWEYFTGTGWSNNPEATQRINSFQVSQQYSVSTYRGKYILLTQDIWLSPKIFSFTSTSPVGPWTNKKHLYTTPETGGDTFTYNAWAHPQFDRNGEMLVSYNVNGDFMSIFSNVELYRPRFIRIPYMNLDYDFWPNAIGNKTWNNSLHVRIAPNPVTENAAILIDLQETQTIRFELIDITGGPTVLYQQLLLPEGEQRIDLETNQLIDGIYLLKITTDNDSYTLPVIKRTN